MVTNMKHARLIVGWYMADVIDNSLSVWLLVCPEVQEGV